MMFVWKAFGRLHKEVTHLGHAAMPGKGHTIGSWFQALKGGLDVIRSVLRSQEIHLSLQHGMAFGWHFL